MRGGEIGAYSIIPVGSGSLLVRGAHGKRAIWSKKRMIEALKWRAIRTLYIQTRQLRSPKCMLLAKNYALHPRFGAVVLFAFITLSEMFTLPISDDVIKVATSEIFVATQRGCSLGSR